MDSDKLIKEIKRVRNFLRYELIGDYKDIETREKLKEIDLQSCLLASDTKEILHHIYNENYNNLQWDFSKAYLRIPRKI